MILYTTELSINRLKSNFFLIYKTVKGTVIIKSNQEKMHFSN